MISAAFTPAPSFRFAYKRESRELVAVKAKGALAVARMQEAAVEYSQSKAVRLAGRGVRAPKSGRTDNHVA